MGLVQVFDYVVKVGRSKDVLGGPIALESVDTADEKESFGIDAGVAAYFRYGGFSESEMQAHSGSDAQQREVDVHEVCHFHGRTHQMAVGAVTHNGTQS